MIADTGTGSTYHSYYDVRLVDWLVDSGLAVISIDPVLSGDRTNGGNPEFAFYNFENPQPSRNNTVQGAADNFSIVRVIQGFSYTEPATGSDPGRTITFDPANIFLFGHSQGGLTGAPFLAFDPDVKAAVLSGTGALLFEGLLGKTLPIDISAITATYIPDNPLDEFNPVLAMLQTWVERSESANYAPLIARAPITGDDGQKLAPKDVYQSEGIVDHWAPNRGLEAMATALGGNQILWIDSGRPWPAVKGLELRGREQLAAPVSGNLAGKTVVLAQYRQAPGSDGHFVASEVFDGVAGVVAVPGDPRDDRYRDAGPLTAGARVTRAAFGTRPIRNTIGGAGVLVGVSNLRNFGSGGVGVLLWWWLCSPAWRRVGPIRPRA